MKALETKLAEHLIENLLHNISSIKLYVSTTYRQE